MMATHATHTNLLLLSVREDPAIMMANQVNYTLQPIVASTLRVLIKFIVNFISALEGV
jgi:hypothetical protein